MLKTNVIHCGECAETMRLHIPDNSIDLTVTSPPYDNLREYNGYTFPFEAIAAELWRVTKPGGVVVWVVADATVNGSETGTSFFQAGVFMGLGFNLHDTMIWSKYGSPFPDKSRYYQTFEFMFVFSNGAPKTTNLITQIATGHGGGVLGSRNKSGTFEPMKYERGHKMRVKDNVWKIANHGKNNKDDLSHSHPARFPESLARDHIISWSNPGDIVLDPMCGSGTTLKMAVEQGRQYIGIDISAEYCELSRKRVAGARVPLPGLVAGKPNKAVGADGSSSGLAQGKLFNQSK